MKKMTEILCGAAFMLLSASPVAFAGKEDAAAIPTGIKFAERNGPSMVLDGAKTNSWGYLTYPADSMPDIEIKGRFKIIYPAKTYNPPLVYWPLNFHYLADEPGYDFGIIVRDQNKGAFYRIQFSAKWDEVSLWKEGEPGTAPEAPSIPSGFFAAVKAKAGINISNSYAFSVKAIGNKIELALNGKQVLSYEDRLLPIEKGGWGLGVFNEARVQVSDLESGKAEGTIAPTVRKRPNFRLANWHGDNVVFDGDEPIARMTQGTAAWMNDVKFKPGYRAQLAWPFIFDRRFRASVWDGVRCTNDTVVGAVASFGKENEHLSGKGSMVLRYDSGKDIYFYDVDMTTTLKTDNSVSHIYDRDVVYYANTYTYNPMPTTEESIKINFENWASAASPYRLALVKGSDGKAYRWPIHHFYWSFVRPEHYKTGGFRENWGGMGLAKDSYFIMYPEKVICPAVKIIALGDGDYESIYDSCCSYWDMHFWFTPVRNGVKVTQLKAGETYRARFRISGYPAAEADKLMAASKLVPCLDPMAERPYYVNGVNKFDKGGDAEITAGRLIWEGSGKWDKSTGRSDAHSMRMENNARLNVYIGYNGSSAAAAKAELTMWIKTDRPWEGAGVRLGIEGRGVFGGADRQWGEYVVPQFGEWQQVKYTVPFPTKGLVCVYIETSGKGECWVDDFEFKKRELPASEVE